MVKFLRNGRSCAVAAGAVLLLVAGCGTGHSRPARASSRPPGAKPAATSTGKKAGFLTAVACLPAGTCVAVGGYYRGSAGPSLTLAMRWNGRAWLAEPTPSRGRDSRLDGVSCATATSCVAVGTPDEAWARTRWTIIPSADPMSSLACAAPGPCQAVGPPPYGRRAVAASWDGRAWQAKLMPEPVPAPQNLSLTGVSCTSARFCVAVGDASRGAGARPSAEFRDRTLALAWNGSGWRIVATPSPSPESQLRGVSCASPTSCTAVGSSAAGQHTLAEHWNGAEWAIQATPSLSRTGHTALTAVSCPSPADCTAVGTYDGAQGIAEHWNSTAWAIQRLPAPPGPRGQPADVVPASVWCISATACMAVGTTRNRTLAEHWNGSTWTVEPTPNPA